MQAIPEGTQQSIVRYLGPLRPGLYNLEGLRPALTCRQWYVWLEDAVLLLDPEFRHRLPQLRAIALRQYDGLPRGWFNAGWLAVAAGARHRTAIRRVEPGSWTVRSAQWRRDGDGGWLHMCWYTESYRIYRWGNSSRIEGPERMRVPTGMLTHSARARHRSRSRSRSAHSPPPPARRRGNSILGL